MKQDDIDWTFLRAGLQLPLIGLLISVVVLAASNFVRAEAERARLSSYETMSQLETESAELNRRRETVDSYRQAYQQLQAAGFIADENRLEWVNALRGGAEQLGLPYLRYSIQAQRRFDDTFPDDDALTNVLGSRMELQLGLIHELDLLRLIDRLAAAPGVFVVTGCALRWVGQAALPLASSPNLSAECELEWLTIPGQM